MGSPEPPIPGQNPASSSPNDCIGRLHSQSLFAAPLSAPQRGLAWGWPSPLHPPERGGPGGPVVVVSLLPTRLTVLVPFLAEWPQALAWPPLSSFADCLPNRLRMGMGMRPTVCQAPVGHLPAVCQLHGCCCEPRLGPHSSLGSSVPLRRSACLPAQAGDAAPAPPPCCVHTGLDPCLVLWRGSGSSEASKARRPK